MTVVKAKTPSGPSAALVAAMADAVKPPSKDKLDKLRTMVLEARTLDTRIGNGEVLLKQLKTDLGEYKNHKIPDFMNEIGLPKIGLDPVGKPGQKKYVPAYECERVPYYSANISADWPEEQKQAAYDYLVEIGHDDLIKNVVSFSFPRGTPHGVLVTFIKMIQKLIIMVTVLTEMVGKNKKTKMVKKKVQLEIPPADLKQGVNGKTLTAWLKSQVEDHGFTPDLTKIGGHVGTVAKLKEVKIK